MSHTNGLISVKQIVQKALWKAKRTEDQYYLFYECVCDGVRELRLHHVKEGLKLVKLTQSAIGTVDFPSDFVSFRAIGVPVNGEFHWLTMKDDMVITTTLVSQVETQDSEDGEGVDILDNTTAGFYAKGGVNVDGYYRIDWDGRRIFLNSTTRTEVVLAYISSGIELSEETYVPVKYEGALIAWAIWQEARYDEKRLQVAQYYEQQYRNEVIQMGDDYTIEEYLDAWISTYSMLPSR